jgi:hypothetical protein
MYFRWWLEIVDYRRRKTRFEDEAKPAAVLITLQ